MFGNSTRAVPGWILAGILLLALGLRLPRVTSPPIGHHAWRQSDTAAISRNFAEEEFHPLRPRVDWRGDSPGYVESEAPVYSFALAVLYRLFGTREWLGRLLSIAFSLVAIGLSFLLVRDARGPAAALWTAFFLAVLPMPVFFGRAIMPEALMLAGLAGATWTFLRYRREGTARWLILSTLCLTLACWIKPVCLYLGLPLAWLAYRRHGCRFPLTPRLWILPILVGVALLAWYRHAHGLFARTGLTFGIWEYGSDKWGNWRLLGNAEFWGRLFLYRIPKLGLAWAGVPLFLYGLLFVRRSADERLFDVWLGALLAYMLVVTQGVFVHDYYLLPAAIPFSYYLGLACVGLGGRSVDPPDAEAGTGVAGSAGREMQTGRRIARPHARAVRAAARAVLVAGIVAVSLSIVWRWYRGEEPRRSRLLPIARLVQERTPQDALVVCLDEKDPTLLYLARRKGWHATTSEIQAPWLEDKVARGARALYGVYRPRSGADRSPYLDTLLEPGSGAIALPDGGFFVELRAPTSP